MAKKKSVVWIWRNWEDEYCLGKSKPELDCDDDWYGDEDMEFCEHQFERLFPFFTMPKNSLGKITNTANTLTFEIVETK